MSNHTGGSALAQEADRQLRTLAARRAALDVEEARWLIVAREEKVHEADHTDDATEALRTLGFSPQIARAAVARAASQLGRDVPLEAFLRACLRECPRPGA